MNDKIHTTAAFKLWQPIFKRASPSNTYDYMLPQKPFSWLGGQNIKTISTFAKTLYRLDHKVYDKISDKKQSLRKHRKKLVVKYDFI